MSFHVKLYLGLQEGDLIFQSAGLTVGFTKTELLDNHKYALKRQANFLKENNGTNSYLNSDWIVKIYKLLLISDLFCFTAIFKNATSYFCLI